LIILIILGEEYNLWSSSLNMDTAKGKYRGTESEFRSQRNTFSCEQRYAIAWNCIDLSSSAVWRFKKVNSCLKMAK
jgi:hypothetical protein